MNFLSLALLETYSRPSLTLSGVFMSTLFAKPSFNRGLLQNQRRVSFTRGPSKLFRRNASCITDIYQINSSHVDII